MRGVRDSVGGNWSQQLLARLKVLNYGPDDLPFGWRGGDDIAGHIAAIGLENEALRFDEESDYVLTLGMFGEPGAGIDIGRTQITEESGFVQRFMFGIILVGAGHYDEGGPILEKVWKRWGSAFYRADSIRNMLAEALIAVRRDANDDEGADEVLQEMRKNVGRLRDAEIGLLSWEYKSVDYQEGVAAYLSGERDEGLELIAKAAKDGYWIQPPFGFQIEMYREPEFELILQKQAIRQAAERTKVLDVVCTDNPYATVWDPLPETCENFAAETSP